MIKKLFILTLLLIVIVVFIGAVIFLYRYQIIQYSAETIIRKALPDYIKIDKINFDFKEGKITLDGFKIINPRDFSYKYLLEVEEISCSYRMKGKNVLEGLEILDPIFKNPILNVERLRNGRLNLTEAQKAMEKGLPKKEEGPAKKPAEEKAGPKVTVRLADTMKLAEDFKVKSGKIIFVDRFATIRPHTINLEAINAKISLRFNDSYSQVLSLASTGEGNVNGKRNEILKWAVSLTPTASKLTMSNRLEASGLDIVTFQPYYDKYSPFVFESGRFSGTLIFDFDNGSIGSTNEVHLSDLRFSIKQGYENALFWETTVPDITKYFSSPFGDIVFDFKIKGEMSNPKFYLGPISKQALASMAIDKISTAIEEVSKSKGGAVPGAPRSDIDKAKDYIELFKGLIDKK